MIILDFFLFQSSNIQENIIIYITHLKFYSYSNHGNDKFSEIY